MTIAACHLSTEGVVLGADSTSSFLVPTNRAAGVGWLPQHFDHAQKLFEFGIESTAGVVLWGLGSVGQRSHRSIIAEAEYEARKKKASSFKEVVDILTEIFWNTYTTELAQVCTQVKAEATTDEEKANRRRLISQFSGGFCVGGRWGNEFVAEAWEINYDPTLSSTPKPAQMAIGQTGFWGWRSLIERLVIGIDQHLINAIVDSGKWAGTNEELLDLIFEKTMFLRPCSDLPIREAIDWVHASLYATIKTMKFGPLENICGGPIEVAVITADRPFRWVCHKSMREALSGPPQQ